MCKFRFFVDMVKLQDKINKDKLTDSQLSDILGQNLNFICLLRQSGGHSTTTSAIDSLVSWYGDESIIRLLILCLEKEGKQQHIIFSGNSSLNTLDAKFSIYNLDTAFYIIDENWSDDYIDKFLA